MVRKNPDSINITVLCGCWRVRDYLIFLWKSGFIHWLENILKAFLMVLGSTAAYLSYRVFSLFFHVCPLFPSFYSSFKPQTNQWHWSITKDPTEDMWTVTGFQLHWKTCWFPNCTKIIQHFQFCFMPRDGSKKLQMSWVFYYIQCWAAKWFVLSEPRTLENCRHVHSSKVIHAASSGLAKINSWFSSFTLIGVRNK